MTILSGMLLVAASAWVSTAWAWINARPQDDSTAMMGRFMFFTAGVLVGGIFPLIALLPPLIGK